MEDCRLKYPGGVNYCLKYPAGVGWVNKSGGSKSRGEGVKMSGVKKFRPRIRGLKKSLGRWVKKWRGVKKSGD